MKKKTRDKTLDVYIPLIKSLAEILGHDCEVLLHDVAIPEGSVIACENAHVTGRKIGAPMTAFGRQLMQSEEYSDRDGIYNYLATTEDGRKLKCSVIFIRDKKRKLLGLICVNMDVSRVENARKLLDDFLNTSDELANPVKKEDAEDEMHEKFYRELDDVWDHLLREVRESFPVPLKHLSPAEIESAIDKLDRDGFFLIKGAIKVLAKELEKSRYTIYGYLRKIREKQGKTNQE